MSSMSGKSEINSRVLICDCGLTAPIRTSNKPWSKGKKFYGCGHYKEKGKEPCKFFQWTEEGNCTDVDGQLRNKIESLMEQNKEIIEQNKEIIKENTRLKNKNEAIFWKMMFCLSWGFYIVMKILG